MLEIRPNCEHCNKALSAEAKDARICSFECTFCANCVEIILKNVCPNCGGDFVSRPIRRKGMLRKYPPSKTPVFKRIDPENQKLLISQYAHIDPSKR